MVKEFLKSSGNTSSLLLDLVCSSCGIHYPSNEIQTFCNGCLAPLLSQYDLVKANNQLDRDEIANRQPGLWRWRELLPINNFENIIYLGEGDTPLLKLTTYGDLLGLKNLYLKDESLNPTGSFKARGLATAVSKAKELGVDKLIIPTAGNAGGAMAAYASRAGLKALIYMPKDTPKSNIEESRITGAEIVFVDGLISDAAALAKTRAEKEGWFDLSTFKEPYRVEGKKIMGYEIAEEFNWILPDVIIYPTGGGTGLVGMWKAFLEMETLSWLDGVKKPRMVSVQASGCAPIVKAYQAGAAQSEYWNEAKTIASGLRVPKSFADSNILKILNESNGTAVAVSDDSILDTQRKLGQVEGIFAAPEGAATLAAVEKLYRENWILPDERVVLFNTGSGLKYIN